MISVIRFVEMIPKLRQKYTCNFFTTDLEGHLLSHYNNYFPRWVPEYNEIHSPKVNLHKCDIQAMYRSHL